VTAGRDAAVTPRSAATHVFVDSLETPTLDEHDRHHLERVLRLRAGTVITVGDGRGGWRPVVLGPELAPCGPVVREAAPMPRLTVAFALVKGERPELIARALTEVGIDRIVPMHTERSVLRWDRDRGVAGVARLRRVVRGAGMQSRRVWLPDVADVTELRSLAAVAKGVAIAVPGGPPPDLARPTILIGPEGGWTEAELVELPGRAGLGPYVLRTETAAIVAGALLVAARISKP
jgi:16S rRNA (uracil1498-N3)-methyltransferase